MPRVAPAARLPGRVADCRKGVYRTWDFGSDGRIGYTDSNENFWHGDKSNKYHDWGALPILGALVAYENGSIIWHVVDLLGPLMGAVALAVGAGAVLVCVWVATGWVFRVLSGSLGQNNKFEAWRSEAAAEEARLNWDASDESLAAARAGGFPANAATEADWDALPQEERQWQAFRMGFETGEATGDFESENPFDEGTTEYEHYEEGRLRGVESNQELWASAEDGGDDIGGRRIGRILWDGVEWRGGDQSQWAVLLRSGPGPGNGPVRSDQ